MTTVASSQPQQDLPAIPRQQEVPRLTSYPAGKERQPVCQALEVEFGRIGIWSSYRPFGIERAGEAARLAEQLGYAAWWVGGSPHIPALRPVLEATSVLVAATGILNVWANDPAETAAADAAVRAEFPGRLMLGIGIGHPEATSDYRRPLTTMRAFLDGLDASPGPPPVDERCLAALGPKIA